VAYFLFSWWILDLPAFDQSGGDFSAFYRAMTFLVVASPYSEDTPAPAVAGETSEDEGSFLDTVAFVGGGSNAGQSSCNIIMYTMNNCGACRSLKQRFHRDSIDFTEYNVDQRKGYRDRFNRKMADRGKGSVGLPALEINGKLTELREIKYERLKAGRC